MSPIFLALIVSQGLVQPDEGGVIRYTGFWRANQADSA